MDIHSNILVHWTGKKDIETSAGADRSWRYVERLKDYYENGLYAKRTSEDVVRKMKIKDLVRICFTEIRLSQAETHAARYGRLGIGFAREFIMNKGGRPVIYIPFDAPANARLLEDSIKNIYNGSAHDKDTHRWAKWTMAHVKRMSDRNGDNFFDELEWRLVYDESDGNPHFRRGKGTGIHRMPFSARDVKVIVTPDDAVREMAFNDKTIGAYLSEHMPIVVTLGDCGDF
jgi:hypothetical protein